LSKYAIPTHCFSIGDMVPDATLPGFQYLGQGKYSQKSSREPFCAKLFLLDGSINSSQYLLRTNLIKNQRSFFEEESHFRFFSYFCAPAFSWPITLRLKSVLMLF